MRIDQFQVEAWSLELPHAMVYQYGHEVHAAAIERYQRHDVVDDSATQHSVDCTASNKEATCGKQVVWLLCSAYLAYY